MTDSGSSRRGGWTAWGRSALRILGLCAVWALFPASPASAQGTFTRHLTITVGGGVVGGPHAGFPLLVDATNADLKTTANLGNVQSPSGYDIVFRGEDGAICGGPLTCMLDHEIELYDGLAGRVVAWVRVPSLANGRVIHMYYGNSRITSSTETTGAVFDADYVGVWHMKELGAGKLNEYRDSSRYGNHGQGGEGDTRALPAHFAGKIGLAQHFGNVIPDETYDFIDAGQDGTLNITGNQITLEAWLQHNITPNTAHGCHNPPYTNNCGSPGVNNPYGILNHKGYGDGYRFYLSGDPGSCPNPNGGLTDVCLNMAIPGSTDLIASSQYGSPATDPVTRGVWHHVAGVYDGAEMKLYVDGQPLLATGQPDWNRELDDGHCFFPDTHCASVGVGGTTVLFDTPLPAGVGPGHVLTFDARYGTVENFLITGVDGTRTQATVSPPAAYPHDSATGSYRITNPFKTGNLLPSLAEQHVFIGQADLPQNVGWSSEFEGDLDEVRISRVARSAEWIATEYGNQYDPAGFAPAGAPGGAAQGLPTFTVNYRSIGTNSADLSAGTATVGLGGTTVTVSASLPVNVGPGDRLDFAGGSPETLYILSRVDATHVTVQTPAAANHAGDAYTIKRAYTTLQAWEDALPASLVALNVREVGVAFSDGPLAAVRFEGSVTDPARSIVLTTNVLDRQRGTPGTGVVLNNTGSDPAIAILDDHVTVERFEITGGSGAGAHGIEFASVNPANLGTARYNLIHGTGGDGVRISDADGIVDVYNNFVFNTNVGIRLLVDMNPAARVNIFSNTVYNSTAAGIASRDAGGAWVRQTSLRVSLRQNIAHSSPVDIEVAKPFDEAYFCTDDPPTAPNCTSRTAELANDTPAGNNVQLNFTSDPSPTTNNYCLYLGSTEKFRGASHWLVTGSTGEPEVEWEYWNGSGWASLNAGAFEDYNFQWNGFGYWPDDPPGWTPTAVSSATSLYYARVCLWVFRAGTATVGAGGTLVTFTSPLPGRVSGDWHYRLVFDDAQPETIPILSVDSPTQVTLGGVTAFAHTNALFRIQRAFGTMPTERLITRADVNVASRYNLARDKTGLYNSLWGSVGVTGVESSAGPIGAGVNFTSATDLHIQSGSVAENAVWDIQRQDAYLGVRGRESSALTGRFTFDLDHQVRPAGANYDCFGSAAACWDIGADEWAAPTAVRLMSFSAVPADGSVTLEWRTGSELDNLGFHVYRGPSADGPWTRLTSSLIPGLGSSPLGQAYSWLDTGLTNGVRYYYRLEDVDTASVSTFHGPVSAMPAASAPPPPGGGGGGGGEPGDGSGGGPGDPATTSCPAWVLAAAPDAVSPTCTRHGDPASVSLDVLSRDASSATLELRTGGFWALHEASGTVRVFVPGLEFPADPRAPALPLRRALVDAVVGKQVELVSAEALDLRSFRELRPSAVGAREVAVSRDGTVRPARRSLAPPAPPVLSRGYLPQDVARLAGTVFQGERKSAVVEITPVRFSASRHELVLAGRVRVKLAFTGVAEGESGTGSRGRAVPRKRALFRDVLAQLYTSRRGLYAVGYEALFPGRPRGLSTSFLRLQRQGEAVPFHVEPSGGVFGPGSVLFFYAERTVSSMEYSSEVAYELVRTSGVRMGTALAPPSGAPLVSSSTGFSSFETNRIYQPGLVEAKDLWLWDAMVSGAARTEGFALSGVDTTSRETARLVVDLQGGSESGTTADHHVRLSVNGVDAGETTFAGKQPYRLELLLPASALREGANELSVVNVGDTGVSSLVFLDRFEVSYPQVAVLRGGVFEGVWGEGGTVEVGGLLGSPVILRDSRLSGPEGSAMRWVTGFATTAGSVRFQVEAGHRYVVVSPEGLLSPRIGRIPLSTLKEGANQADYLVIAPREFLEAATPLLERRRGQGLTSRAVSFQEIASEFGHGQPSAEAIREFLAYAYDSWQRPSPRYVLLLGDATDDPQHFQATSWASPLPALRTKTSYLWTASDPALGAVNGEDRLPDLAIGRLPATTREQAEGLVSKLLAWEASGQDLAGSAVLVADTPDQGGDFEADVEDVRASFLSGRATTTIKVRDLGGATRPAILESFDEGASLMSYVGHGGTAVWSSANVLNSWDTASLRAQSRQPLLLTMNCLNAYFVAPNFDALPEALLKAEGRGVVGAFSPSGLSLDGPAHEYHRAVMAELVSGRHERLGDAILAAQRSYAQTGLMPELLTVYHLLGDPATRIRQP